MQKVFEWFIQIIGWLQIAASPLLIGLVIGAAICFPTPTTIRLIIGITVAAIGLIIGILWANKIWKTKEGTMSFLSRVMATPELDKKEKETRENESENKK